jgi:multicomponent Na+:H+ antiporter subunit E
VGTNEKQAPDTLPSQRVSEWRQPWNLAKKRLSAWPFMLTFLIMTGFWVVFSGKFDIFHLSLGVVSCLIVATLSSDLLFPSGITFGFLSFWLKFAAYIPWLLYQVFLANLRVLYLAFHPRMMDLIDPQIIEFDSALKSDIALTTFANSITLTPGTITIKVNVMGHFSVHCIDRVSSQSLPGDMERKIISIFKE